MQHRPSSLRSAMNAAQQPCVADAAAESSSSISLSSLISSGQQLFHNIIQHLWYENGGGAVLNGEELARWHKFCIGNALPADDCGARHSSSSIGGCCAPLRHQTRRKRRPSTKKLIRTQEQEESAATASAAAAAEDERDDDTELVEEQLRFDLSRLFTTSRIPLDINNNLMHRQVLEMVSLLASINSSSSFGATTKQQVDESSQECIIAMPLINLSPGRHWEQQGGWLENPSEELRAMGFLGLIGILYMFSFHYSFMRKLQKQTFMLSISMLHVMHIVLRQMKDGVSRDVEQLVPFASHSCESYALQVFLSMTLVLAHEFERIWSQKRYHENFFHQVIEEQIEQKLRMHRRCTDKNRNALRKSRQKTWIQWERRALPSLLQYQACPIVDARIVMQRSVVGARAPSNLVSSQKDSPIVSAGNQRLQPGL